MTLVELATQRRDAFITDWENWRDAQMTDEHRHFVDECYAEIIDSYDLLIRTLQSPEAIDINDVPF